MLLGTTLGSNPFSSIARGVATAVRDPRVQNVANVAARTYAPQQYARAQATVSQVQKALGPPRRPGVPPAPPMYPPQGYGGEDNDGGGGGGGGGAPVGPINKQSHILVIAAAVGIGLVLVLTMRK